MPAERSARKRHIEGDVAVVTGASRGIGAATVRALRDRGMVVHALARTAADLTTLAEHTGAEAHVVDVCDTPALSASISAIRPTVLVNNAAVLPEVGPFADLTPQTIDEIIAVNLTAALHASRAALPAMVGSNHGHVVFVGSIAGRVPSSGNAVYAASKAALHMFADVLRLDVLGTGIRVTTVMPGRVETGIYDKALGGHARAAEALYEGTEAVRPADVAEAIVSVLEMPPNVDVTTIELMPTRQAYGGNQIAKEQA